MSDELAKCPSCEWPLPEDVVTFCGNCGTEFDQENEALPIAPGEQSVACPAAASGDVGPGQAPGRSANGKQQGLATAQVPSPPQQNLASGTAAAAEPSVPQPPVGMEQICLQDGPSEKMETAPMQAAPPTDQETRGTSRPSAERDAQVASFTQPQPQPTGDDIPPLSSQSGRGGPADSPYGASPDDAAEQHGKPSPAGSPEPVEASSDCEELEFAVDVGRFFFEDVVFPVRFALKALHEDLRDVEVTARTIELGTGKEVMLSKTFSRLKAGVAKEGNLDFLPLQGMAGLRTFSWTVSFRQGEERSHFEADSPYTIYTQSEEPRQVIDTIINNITISGHANEMAADFYRDVSEDKDLSINDLIDRAKKAPAAWLVLPLDEAAPPPGPPPVAPSAAVVEQPAVIPVVASPPVSPAPERQPASASLRSWIIVAVIAAACLAAFTRRRQTAQAQPEHSVAVAQTMPQPATASAGSLKPISDARPPANMPASPTAPRPAAFQPTTTTDGGIVRERVEDSIKPPLSAIEVPRVSPLVIAQVPPALPQPGNKTNAAVSAPAPNLDSCELLVRALVEEAGMSGGAAMSVAVGDFPCAYQGDRGVTTLSATIQKGIERAVLAHPQLRLINRSRLEELVVSNNIDNLAFLASSGTKMRGMRVKGVTGLLNGHYTYERRRATVTVQLVRLEDAQAWQVSGTPAELATMSETALPQNLDDSRANRESVEAMLALLPNRGVDTQIWVSGGRTTFAGGEHITFTVRAALDCHVAAFVHQVDGTTVLLFPNTHCRDSYIRAGELVSIPGRGKAGFAIEIGPPFGTDIVQVVACTSQEALDELIQSREAIPETQYAVVKRSELSIRFRGMRPVADQQQPIKWGEAHCFVATYPR